MNNAVYKLVVHNLAEITGYDLEDITLEDSLTEDLGLDSMMLMDFHRLIVNEYPEFEQVEIDEVISSGVDTVQSVIEFVQTELGLSSDTNEEWAMNQLEEVIAFDEYFSSIKDVPYFKVNSGIASNKIELNGEKKINFSTYNYLGINGSKEINDKVTEAIHRYGTSVSGSRLLSGEIEIHQQLEQKIASFIGTEAAIVQVGGHSTNVNVIGNVVGEDDLILHDALSHNSIIQGARLSHAKRKPFRHNDMKHLESELKKLRKKFRRVLIVVEGVYSMDGDICNLPELIRLKNQYDAILMVDEAHSIGTIGENGRGVTSYFNVNPMEVDILMGTLSKSLNSCGGYIAGAYKFINYLKYNSPGFIFSVGMTPANTAAALASFEILENDPTLTERLRENAAYFLNRMKEIGADTGLSEDTPVIPLIIGDSKKALELSEVLYEKGINALPIVYPAVKESEARIRFFISAAHTKEDMDFTIEVLQEVIPEFSEGELVTAK